MSRGLGDVYKRQWVQHLTVFEPDDSMIEVAIAAVTPVLPETPEEGKW